MALVRCPDCDREISDAAPACPGCGRPNAAAMTHAEKHARDVRLAGGLEAVGAAVLSLGVIGALAGSEYGKFAMCAGFIAFVAGRMRR